MSHAEAQLPELLRRRLDLVGRMSQATSQMQKWQQVRMSAEMEALRCELSGDVLAAAQDLQRDLHEAQCRAEEADSGMARCEALMAEIEHSLSETDLEIEAVSRG